MIRAERIEVGEEPIDLTEGSGLSGVTVQLVRNAAGRNRQSRLLVGGTDPDGENAVPLLSGESGFQNVTLGSSDHLHVRAEKGTIPVDVVLSWS